jgi:hypothetical protein
VAGIYVCVRISAAASPRTCPWLHETSRSTNAALQACSKLAKVTRDSDKRVGDDAEAMHGFEHWCWCSRRRSLASPLLLLNTLSDSVSFSQIMIDRQLSDRLTITSHNKWKEYHRWK